MLFRNVYRTLKKQYVQLILLGIIITLSSFIYTTMDYGISGILPPTEEYFDIANQEDFAISSLDLILEDDYLYIMNNCTVTEVVYTLSALKNVNSTCYYNVMENRLNLIRAEYNDITIELREHKDVYFDFEDSSYKIRFLKETHNINLSYFVSGVTPSNNDEIAISEAFALKNDLDVGDNIEINSKEYRISGFVLFPDYSLALFSESFIIDNKTQSIGLVTDAEFENFSENVAFEIAGVFTNGNNDSKFEENVIDDFRDNDNLEFVTNILLTANVMRSGAIYAEIEGGQGSSLALSLIIAAIALLIVGIMVSKVLQSQRGAIGILKSMGFTNNEITLPYIFFIAILSFPAIILGYFLGVLAAEQMKNTFLEYYLLPSVEITQTFGTLMVAVIVPFIFLLLLSYVIIMRILNKKPVELLNPQVSASSTFVTKRMGIYLRRLKISKKIKHLLLYRNIVKFLVFIIGMFFSAFLILMSLSMLNIFDKITVDYYNNTDHNYIGYCDYFIPCEEPTGSQEKVIEIPSVVLNEEDTYLVGLNSDSDIHKLIDSRGRNITSELENGLIITKSLSLTTGFRVGDELLLEVGELSVNIEVVAITEEYTGDKAYINRSDLGNLLANDSEYFNAIYSETKLLDTDFKTIISTQDIVDQSKEMQGYFDTVFTILIGASIIIGAIIIYILTVLTIEDNFYNISLFKVIGYNNKEIDKMILGGYFLYGTIIFLIMLPIAYFSFIIITQMFVDYYGVIFPLEFEIWHGLVSLILFIILFNIGALVAKRNLNKISLQEAMKMYQI